MSLLRGAQHAPDQLVTVRAMIQDGALAFACEGSAAAVRTYNLGQLLDEH